MGQHKNIIRHSILYKLQNNLQQDWSWSGHTNECKIFSQAQLDNDESILATTIP
jgi:hypothetical protein